MRADKFRLLFFGSDRFSIRVLDYLLQRRICPTEVIAKPHTLLDEYAANHRLNRHAWPHGLQDVPTSTHNIGLVASFGSLIDEATVERFSQGLFNVHPSLLPKYRGPSPIQSAVFEGAKETGCTIMRIPPVAKFDIGDIVLQKRLAIEKDEYAIHLRDRLADLGARMAEQLLTDFDSCIRQAVAQDSSQKSLTRKLQPLQGHLKFRTDCSKLIERKVRAYTGFINIFIICLGGMRVELDGMVNAQQTAEYQLDQLVSNSSDSDASVILAEEVVSGTIYFHKLRRQLCIKAADRNWLAYTWATPERKPRMSALDFYNGYLSKVSQHLRLTDV